MSNGTNTTFPSPDVYLNHLTPAQVKEFEIARNVYIGVLGAVACDVLAYIPEDIRTLKRSSGFVTPACFVLARFFALVYMALWVTMATTPLKECKGVPIASSFFCVVTMATTGFLFLRRVHAVYADLRSVRWIFSFLWFASCGVVIGLIPGSYGKHIPGTEYCTIYAAGRWVPFDDFMPALFDTLVFIAVSYRLAFQTHRELGTQKSWSAAWFSTKGLPTMSKAMLRGGQQYYLAAFLIQFLGGVFSFQKFVPGMDRIVCTIPGVALSACLACRAHRKMVEAFHRREGSLHASSGTVSAINFAPGNPPHPSNTIMDVESGVVERKESGSAHTSV